MIPRGLHFQLLIAVKRLANRPAADEVDDRQQDDRAEQRKQEVGARNRRWYRATDVATAEDQAGNNRADDADDDVKKMPCWASVRMTRLASQPTDTADDEPNDDPMMRSLLFVAASFERRPSGIKTHDARMIVPDKERLLSSADSVTDTQGPGPLPAGP